MCTAESVNTDHPGTVSSLSKLEGTKYLTNINYKLFIKGEFSLSLLHKNK